jgi:hypothetical protein
MAMIITDTTVNLNLSQVNSMQTFESLDQSPTTSSRIMLSLPSTQGSARTGAPSVLTGRLIDPVILEPVASRRIPGSGKASILRISPDFDAPVDW